MKKTLILLALAVGLIAGGCILSFDDSDTDDETTNTTLASTNETEPNDAVSYGTTITLDLNEIGIGTITTDNADYWKVELVSGNSYTVSVETPSGKDSLDSNIAIGRYGIWQYGTSSSPLNENDGAGNGETETFTADNTTTYYVRVAGSGAEPTGDYEILVESN